VRSRRINVYSKISTRLKVKLLSNDSDFQLRSLSHVSEGKGGKLNTEKGKTRNEREGEERGRIREGERDGRTEGDRKRKEATLYISYHITTLS